MNMMDGSACHLSRTNQAINDHLCFNCFFGPYKMNATHSYDKIAAQSSTGQTGRKDDHPTPPPPPSSPPTSVYDNTRPECVVILPEVEGLGAGDGRPVPPAGLSRAGLGGGRRAGGLAVVHPIAKPSVKVGP